MSFNLTSVLTEQDKNLIKEYVHSFGVPSHFIGVENWLKDWGKSKIKLYKLLGNQLVYKVPFEWEKDENELYQQIAELYKEEIREDEAKDVPETPYKKWSLFGLFNKIIKVENGMNEYNFICTATVNKNCKFTLFLSQITNDIINIRVLNHNKIDSTYKMSYYGCKKELQIQKGAKVLKALKKIIDYIKPLIKTEEGKQYYNILLERFEDIRIKHSMILNDKVVKGNLVFSIHPLDFMTMSDNNSNWQSCMSWAHEGCYRIGTVEMMNSNNVLCCYIENAKKEFSFKNNDTGEIFFWPNKRWRMLSYITPDIIMTGKSYPYANDKLNTAVLENLRDLAKRNLRWSYKFGPERYEDMKWINSTMSMERARGYRMLPKSHYHKKNIIFDTKGMYNDILNDHSTKYWCVRNEVDKTKIISLSGRSNCLCCNENVAYVDYPDDQYNERYRGVGQLICDYCQRKYFKCSICGCSVSPSPSRNQLIELGDKQYCRYCYDTFIKICPFCKEPFSIVKENNLDLNKGIHSNLRNIYLYNKNWISSAFNIEVATEEEITKKVCYNPSQLTKDTINPAERYFIPIFGHNKCIEKEWGDKISHHHVKLKPYHWSSSYMEEIDVHFLDGGKSDDNKPTFPGIAKCYYSLLSNVDEKHNNLDEQIAV